MLMIGVVGQQAAWTTTVYSSASLDGPWEPHVNLLGAALKGTTGLSQNVAPIMEVDGSVKLMIKGSVSCGPAFPVFGGIHTSPALLVRELMFATCMPLASF